MPCGTMATAGTRRPWRTCMWRSRSRNSPLAFSAETRSHTMTSAMRVTQERWRHLPAELCEHGGERRLLVAELALEGAGARAQHLRHSVQTRDRFRQLGPQHPAHPLAHGSLAAERRERLLGQPVEIAG